MIIDMFYGTVNGIRRDSLVSALAGAVGQHAEGIDLDAVNP
jgi:hypothetical protein